MILNNLPQLRASYYSNLLPTIVLVHDMGTSSTSSANAILVPAILAARDANVIAVDWSRGANHGNLLSSFFSVAAADHAHQFLDWLRLQTFTGFFEHHIIGVGHGGLMAGFIGLRLSRHVARITALDPAKGHEFTRFLPPLTPNVAQYSEVIHTDAGNTGYAQPIGHVDFYPNGGSNMPGCGGDSACNRLRAVYYFAESITTGGFTGVECEDWRDAATASCTGSGRLALGGLENNKRRERGTFYVSTNASPPFSRG